MRKRHFLQVFVRVSHHNGGLRGNNIDVFFET